MTLRGLLGRIIELIAASRLVIQAESEIALARLLADVSPRSDPLLEECIARFGWEKQETQLSADPGVLRVLARRRDLAAVPHLAYGDVHRPAPGACGGSSANEIRVRIVALLVGMTFATGQLSHGMADTMRIAAFGRQARQQNLRPPALAGNLDRTAELIESLYGAGPAGFRRRSIR